ncbi:major facilitator superfamily transporter [Apiospora rasikravindrae]|uniref:Major facilitator superfamily transporter n=1 Tax=Apiospora rasikravindrae TaxID=990691 RepID=A0ABR1U269_9PEZI
MVRLSLSSAAARPLSIDNPAFHSRPEVIESPPSPPRHASYHGDEDKEKEKDMATVAEEQHQRSEVSSLADPEKPEMPEKPEKPFHVFPVSYKRMLIAIIGVAGLFSGLSSNIYFPATKTIADRLAHHHVVPHRAGHLPLFWGSLSDTIGRRPIYIASFIVYVSANIALSFSPNFAVVLLFRGLQSAGSASTVSIGNGVIQDIAHPSEKGAYISFYQAIRNFSIAVGPVLGGILAEKLGFRSIFVFLVILSGAVFVLILFLLPETLRTVAGDGSVRLRGIYQPFFERIVKAPAGVHDQEDDSLQRKKVSLQSFLAPLKLLGQPDVLLHLIFGGMIYAVWSMVTSSTTSIFKGHFGLDELEIGLAFLPNGVGTIVGSSIVGYLMTKDFRAAEVAYNVAHGNPEDQKLPAKKMPVDFPIERTRLRHLPWIAGLFVLSTAGYGLSFLTDADPDPETPQDWRIVIPLIMQFIVAATSNAVFAANQSLVSDLCPGQGAGSTAINNLVRCSLGALGVAVVEMMISSFGPIATYVGLALFITVVATPFAVVNWIYGPGWRVARVERQRAMQEEDTV